ncbi:MAG: 2-oxo acid dehydrogenase subunit E2 [Bdellovibrionaceae bacterium]|nr:2-oxo acid dehydrogenase subunit E2 [Pseudobdellovibrionaceae bacterium]
MSSVFRKLAPGIWTNRQMGMIYAHVDLDIHDVHSITEMQINKSKSPFAWVLFVLFKSMHSSPEICRVLTLGGIWRNRKMSFTVVADRDSSDLRFFKLEPTPEWTVDDFQEAIEQQLQLMQDNWDHHNGWSFRWIKKFPSFLLSSIFKLMSILFYDFKISGKFLGLDKNPFSPVIVSNIGSLSLDQGHVPLVPFMRNMMSIGIGKIQQKAVVHNNQITARWTLPLSFTIDHRYMDGVHCNQILKKIRATVTSTSKTYSPE